MWKKDEMWPSRKVFEWRPSFLGVSIRSEVADLDFMSWKQFFLLWFKILRSQRMKKDEKSGSYGISQRALSGWVARQDLGWGGRHLSVLGPIYARFFMFSVVRQRSQVIWVCPKFFRFLVVARQEEKGPHEQPRHDQGHKKSNDSTPKKKESPDKQDRSKVQERSERPRSQSKVTKKKSVKKKAVSYKKKFQQSVDKAPSSGGRRKKAARKKKASSKP